ncbi:hypothetical protein H310_14079 [Aphanomyces invadans]|uniref:Chromo domain-containing protein n=1 Tax=Aphanomyces invadans TaxID=157072 RepID=A0A024TCX4_9STRA|nr:hypothetical protein H310_14079 [Aphanomyces invadans]ETV91411.1 hypothetical protein H310_14079 [Aphanomyces invadans]|eukprot:XP_008880039.1 hypothetical protein H310_14079 [Aphanomyces invadans]
MYHEGGREVTDGLVEQVACRDGGVHVECPKEARNAMNGHYEVHVKWLGLDAEESPWVLVERLLEDIPVILRKWCDTQMDEDHVSD